MKRLAVFLLPLLAFVVVEGQLLSLPDVLRDLVPTDLRELLDKLSDKQKELLKKADVNHNLGAKAVIATLTLIDHYEKLTPEAQKFGLDLVDQLSKADAQTANQVLRNSKELYKKLDDKAKQSIKDQFPNVAKNLE